MSIRIEVLTEPKLRFGKAAAGVEPRLELAHSGPYTAFTGPPRKLELGLVCLAPEREPIRRWFDSMERLLAGEEANAERFREFPGTVKALNCSFVIPDAFVRVIDAGERARIARLHPVKRFEALLDLYTRKVEGLFVDGGPATVIVALPEEEAELRILNPKLSQNERDLLEHLQQQEDRQTDLFTPDPDELKRMAELKPQSEELLYRRFYRALKARLMQKRNAVPIQVVREHTWRNEKATQSPATRAWNLAVSLFYKTGNMPWKPRDLPENYCFIGLSFHHLKRQGGDVMYASVAQAFSTTVLPFVLRGAVLGRDQLRRRQPYLTESQSADLITRVIKAYEDLAGVRPDRVVVHKTSRYQPEEVAGFEVGRTLVPAIDLIWLAQTGFRLVKKGVDEVWRGTLVNVNDADHYLFTTGFVPWWREYPGPHIPSPLRFGCPHDTDLTQRAREILALTKMNWNSSDGLARYPVTISFARRVGTIMTELADDPEPNPSYRFYM